jgi:hypothetical protein
VDGAGDGEAVGVGVGVGVGATVAAAVDAGAVDDGGVGDAVADAPHALAVRTARAAIWNTVDRRIVRIDGA